MIIQAHEKLKELNLDDFGTLYIGYNGVPEYGYLSNDIVSSYVEDYLMKNEGIDTELSNILGELLIIDNNTSRNEVVDLLDKVVRILNINILKSSHKWLLVCLDLKLKNLSADPLYGLLELSDFWINWGQLDNSPHMIQGVNNDVDAYDYYSDDNYVNMIHMNTDWLNVELNKVKTTSRF
ncbi:MAG: DUF2247 family protein [Acinetobacter sp.]